MFISARETKKIKTDRTIPFFSLHWPPPPFFSPLLLLPISALVSPASCSLLGTWHKKRKKKMIKSSADPWNLYVILHFFWLYLKEKKKTKSSAILVANWLFSLLHRVYVQFFNFFFKFLPIPFFQTHFSLLSSHFSLVLYTVTRLPPIPYPPSFDSLVFINECVCLYFARGWCVAISFNYFLC